MDCTKYKLDTAANFLGDSTVITRCAPVILDDTLYLVNAVMSNIGPQLYAIDKYTGKLKWAAAYYPPEGAGNYITTKGDYSKYRGSNMRVSDLNPLAIKVKYGKERKKYIFVGISSLQNAINVGIIQTGIPVYKDQGFLFCISDLDTHSELVWKTPTCAPLIKVGDRILKGGNPVYDPFRPDSEIVRILSVTSKSNNFVQPYFMENPPAPGKSNTTAITTTVKFDAKTNISKELVQPIWNIIGKNIYQDNDRNKPYNLDELISVWKAEQQNMKEGEIITHTIWGYVNNSIIEMAREQEGNDNIIYFKYLKSGQIVQEEMDAQGLNYWGNTTWGASPLIDLDSNLIYFTTGQGHEIPLDEALFYNQPQYNFYELKKPVVDITTLYIEGQVSLESVNRTKDKFTTIIRKEALNWKQKSPRGRMSYSDAIMAAYIFPYRKHNGEKVSGGSLALGVRIVPYDTYTFLDSSNSIVYPLNNIDGDLSSGVHLYKRNDEKFISTMGKGGLSFTIDVSHINSNITYNHINLRDKGVIPKKWVYSGPNGLLGGANYKDTRARNLLIGTQGNMSWFGGAKGSNGQLEEYVSKDGRVFNINNSYLQSYDIRTGEIIWETPYDNRAFGQVINNNENIFSEDSPGSLYIFNASDGKIVWKFNGKPYGIYGGIASPAVNNGQVIWMSNYPAYGVIGASGPNGVAFAPNNKILIDDKTTPRSMLIGRTFKSWDSSPKYQFEDPSKEPAINTTITHKWYSDNGHVKVRTVHKSMYPKSTKKYTFVLKSFNTEKKTVKFYNQDHNSTIVYIKLRLINTKIYQLIYKEKVGN